jgi:hypothetical protein
MENNRFEISYVDLLMPELAPNASLPMKKMMNSRMGSRTNASFSFMRVSFYSD